VGPNEKTVARVFWGRKEGDEINIGEFWEMLGGGHGEKGGQ
jgi:hypothetical protein